MLRFDTEEVNALIPEFCTDLYRTYIQAYTQVMHRSGLKQGYLYYIDLLPQYENLYVGLCGGELFYSYA